MERNTHAPFQNGVGGRGGRSDQPGVRHRQHADADRESYRGVCQHIRRRARAVRVAPRSHRGDHGRLLRARLCAASRDGKVPVPAAHRGARSRQIHAVRRGHRRSFVVPAVLSAVLFPERRGGVPAVPRGAHFPPVPHQCVLRFAQRHHRGHRRQKAAAFIVGVHHSRADARLEPVHVLA